MIKNANYAIFPRRNHITYYGENHLQEFCANRLTSRAL